MKKRRFILVGALALVLLSAAAVILLSGSPDKTSRAAGYDPEALPAVLTEEAFAGATVADRIVGFSGRDYTAKDFTRLSLTFLAEQSFDQNTRWPERPRLPAGFAPDAWLESARDPGLGVRALHNRGLTGRGVVLAVFDKPILADHQEFAGRLHYHEVAPRHEKSATLHFHGMGVASFVAGASCGVAPEATVHYFAVPNAGRNFLYYSQAIELVLELNRSLPPAEQVRLVVIADGIFPDDRDWGVWQAASARAAEHGLAVLLSKNVEGNGFVWGGAPPQADRDDPTMYLPAIDLRDLDLHRSVILVPGDDEESS